MTDYLSPVLHLSTDTIVLIVAFALFFFMALRFGAPRLISSILALYIAIFLYMNVGFIATVSVLKGSTANLFWNNFAILLILFIPIHILLNRHIVADLGFGARRYFKAALLSIVFVGLALAMFYHVIPLKAVYDFSPAIDKLFATDTAFSIWLIAPIAALFI